MRAGALHYTSIKNHRGYGCARVHAHTERERDTHTHTYTHTSKGIQHDVFPIRFIRNEQLVSRGVVEDREAGFLKSGRFASAIRSRILRGLAYKVF